MVSWGKGRSCPKTVQAHPNRGPHLRRNPPDGDAEATRTRYVVPQTEPGQGHNTSCKNRSVEKVGPKNGERGMKSKTREFISPTQGATRKRGREKRETLGNDWLSTLKAQGLH